MIKFIGDIVKGEPTIIFIPGAMMAPSIYEGISNTLPCQSIVIDWNNSDGPWTIDGVSEKIIELIENYQLNDVIVSGYSQGGVIALATATLNHKSIKGIIISNTGASASKHGDPNFPIRIKESWPSEEVFTKLAMRCFAKPISKGLFDKLFKYAMELKKETVYEAAMSVRSTDLTDRLKNITCSTLVIHGVLDKARSIEHANVIVENISNSKLVTLECGHTPFIDDRESYLDYFLSFLKEIEFSPKEDFDVFNISSI